MARGRKPNTFDPAQVRFYPQSDPRWGKLNRVYWYAYEYKDGKAKVYYIGKSLPEEYKPYVTNSAWAQHEEFSRRQPYGEVESKDIGAAIERGEQVIIDIAEIASACNASVARLSRHRFLLYKEPDTNVQSTSTDSLPKRTRKRTD